MKWQPIETAPKDGTEILGWRKDCGVLIIRYTCCAEFMTCREVSASGMSEDDLFKDDWFCSDFLHGSRLEGDEITTHWMPLPEPPEQS